ncbi:MAG: phytanoyl-CoA dioxygenase family protein [Rhodospirillales bacterium]
MTKVLSTDAVERFNRDGFYFPVRVMSTEDALGYRRRLEASEAGLNGHLESNMRHKVHLLFTWAAELVRHPKILDTVEDLLGPNLLCWTTNFFIKEPHDPGFVSWHQDATYWGLDPDDVVTAWLALSDAPVESGAMKVIPGSHRWPQMDHRDTFHEHNLLSRGQEIAVEVKESEAVYMPLKAGEVSLHHVKLAHGSAANSIDDRRIGLAIRYVPPHVRQKGVRDCATLVRGRDDHRFYDLEPAPKADLDAAAVAAHADAVSRQVTNLYQGTDKTEFRA